MFDRIRELIDYVENVLTPEGFILIRVNELLVFIRQYSSQGSGDNGPMPTRPGYSQDQYSTLRTWLNENSDEQVGVVIGGFIPTWLLPILIRLAEDSISKWCKENKPNLMK